MNSALAPAQQQPASSELATALGACRRAFVATAVFSGMSNLLMLTGALFMLEVYDRILLSRSVPTLVALLFLVAGLYAAQGMIDAIRSRILVRVGHSLDESMSGRVYDAIVRLPLKIGGKGEGTQPIRDLDNVRSFLSGSGPVAFFDLPWMPVYLAIGGGSAQAHRYPRPARRHRLSIDREYRRRRDRRRRSDHADRAGERQSDRRGQGRSQGHRPGSVGANRA